MHRAMFITGRTIYTIAAIITRWFNCRKLRKIDCPYIIQDVKGSLMILDTSDKGISVDLYANKLREPCFTGEFCNTVLKPGQIVIDIGANIGYYALMEARLVGETGLVYAIEPVTKNYDLLGRNLQLNNIGNVETYKIAIGDYTGDVDIGLSEHGNLCSIGNTLEKYGHETIPITTLDEFTISRNIKPDVIRMDVEGYCPEIIAGGIKTLRDNNMALCMELHPTLLRKMPDKYKGLITTLQQLKYRVRFASMPPDANVESYPMVDKGLRLLGRLTGYKTGRIDVSLEEFLTDTRYCGAHAAYALELILRKD